jgi:hypothetical protein
LRQLKELRVEYIKLKRMYAKRTLVHKRPAGRRIELKRAGLLRTFKVFS